MISPNRTPTTHEQCLAMCTGLAIYAFPVELAASSLRPNIAIYSLSMQVVILVELTVPLEHRVAATHTIKANRFVTACKCKGFNAIHLPVEVGIRGFVAQSFSRFRFSVPTRILTLLVKTGAK